MRIFTAAYEGNQGTSIPRTYEKKTPESSVWVFGLFPFSTEKADAIMTKMQEVIEKYAHGDSCEECFENILKEANNVLPGILDTDSEKLLRNGSLLIALLRDDELYISHFGQGEVFLHRNNALIEISEGLSPTDAGGEIFQNISNGDIQAGDRLIFSTYRLQRYITERQLSQMLNDGVTESMDEITTMLDPMESGTVFLLHSKADTVFANVPAHEILERKKGRVNWQNHLEKLPNFSAFFRRHTTAVKAKWNRFNKNQLIIIATIFLALFLLILFFLLLSGEDTKKNTAQYQEFLSTIDKQLNDADQQFAMGNANEATVILNRIETTAKKMLTDRVNVPKAEEILQFVNSRREYVSGIMRISNPEIVSDLSTVNPEIHAKGFFHLENEIITYDDTSLYRTLIAGTNAETLGTIVTNDTIVTGTDFSDKDRAVFLTKGGNVIEWDGSQAVTADTADSTWKSATELKTFSKYVYFLSPSDQQIWRYERRDSGYTLPEAWVNVGGETIQKAKSFAIDGNIYVLTDDGEIAKFYRGEKVNYAVIGLPDEKLMGDIIFTNENLAQIFVLDIANASISIFSKGENEAAYEKKIIIENAGTPVDIFANDNHIFVLTTQRIVEIPLT